MHGTKAILFKSSTLTARISSDMFAWESIQLLTLERRLSSDGLALSGSNQARKGRLVDALAVRGDEGRDTLR